MALPRVAVFLLAAGVASAGASVLTGQEAQRLREYAAIVRPARATLRSVEVRRWLPSRDNWSAFGTFDIVAGDHRGQAEGSLIPSSFYAGKPRRYQVPRAEAEQFRERFEVGRTYDGFWNPEMPDGVFFDPVPVADTEQLVFRMRAAAVVLLGAGTALSLFWNNRSRR